jgi:cytochrome c oxidase cbb3-type subunit 3
MIEMGIGLLATALIAAGLLAYAWQEPVRIEQAQAAQLETDLNDAMTLYAENCAVCHGLAGEGIGATPPLDNPALADSDPASLAKIIARGLYNTSMPAWALEDGGPLSDYQIGELVSLIQFGGWEQVQERVVNLGLAPMVPFATEADPAILEQVALLPGGELLAQGINLYAQECVACHGADGLGTSLAPALNDPAVREQTVDVLTRTVVNGVAGTLMAPWEHALEQAELEALVNLIQNWDRIPSGAIPAPDRPIPVTAESLALGEQLYASTCIGCHGAEGEGTQRAPSLNVKGFLTETSDAAIEQIVTLGVPGTSMPAWGDRISEAEIQAVVGFIRSWEPTAPEVAQPSRVRGPWWQSAGSPPSSGTSSGQNLPSGGTGSGHTSGESVPAGGAGQGSGGGQTPGDPAASETAGNHTGTPPWSASTAAPAWWDNLDPRILALGGGLSATSLVLIGAAFLKLRKLG